MKFAFGLFLILLSSYGVQAQRFDFAAKDAVKVPITFLAQVKQYIEKHDGVPIVYL
ncbi:hypothetical protein [Hymenobacter oligotrophus]|uniref:hypothetical protein n=1 Tax=Hymenobacter oligotrophus TaxID=2319843 RepID=UPI0013C2B91C|nr:hypothetical protein [Hymenobacter oligotrophus]